MAYVFDGVTLAWLADPDGAEQDSVFVLLSHLLDFSATGSKPGEQAAENSALGSRQRCRGRNPTPENPIAVAWAPEVGVVCPVNHPRTSPD
jgi:hypothetical protein